MIENKFGLDLKSKGRVVVKPLGDFDFLRFSKHLEAAVRSYGCEPELSRERLPLYNEDYVASRRQYDATMLLLRLPKLKGNEKKVLGVTSVDIFVPRLNFVFGLANVMKGIAILSTARLTAFEQELGLKPSMIDERVFKETAHELGHLFGLGHCPEPTCIMSFANGVNDVDGKLPMLCPDCMDRIKG
ncbi:MAG: archaemetzincin family Zn-dependent metalloprotease [Nitrososphaerales archaeon]